LNFANHHPGGWQERGAMACMSAARSFSIEKLHSRRHSNLRLDRYHALPLGPLSVLGILQVEGHRLHCFLFA
jgi:hypothetical protein